MDELACCDGYVFFFFGKKRQFRLGEEWSGGGAVRSVRKKWRKNLAPKMKRDVKNPYSKITNFFAACCSKETARMKDIPTKLDPRGCLFGHPRKWDFRVDPIPSIA